ncbi:hypothetical protein ACFL4W_01655 [Planctomycetota bacterium]
MERGRIIWDEEVQMVGLTEGEVVLDYETEGLHAGFSLKCGHTKCS